MPSPYLSLVVVNWNTRDLLVELLRGLTGEAAFAHEILVVDNQSSDGSVAAVEREFPDVITLPQNHNGGFAFGVNRGLERARGEWIALVNTDALVSLDGLEQLVCAAEREHGAAVFGPRILDEHGAVQPSTWARHLPRHYLPQALFLDRLRRERPPEQAVDVDCVSGCVFLIRAAVLPELGGFDERFFMYFEEADFCERVRRAGKRVRLLPEVVFVHVGGLSAQRAAAVTFLAFRESCLLYHCAWHGRLWTEWIRLCLLLGVALRLLLWLPMACVGRGRARLHAGAAAMLLRPGLVAELCRRPRRVPKLPATAGPTT